MDQQFFLALLQIIGINIVLSGDNAVVIALACRSLPPKQQKWGIILGAGAAVVMRIIFTVFVVVLMATPFLKIAGGLLLFWIGYKLMTEEEAGEGDVHAAGHLMGAVRTVLIADAVMSLDNVIAVAAAAKGSYILLILGLAISIPLVVYGAQLMIKLIQRFPVVITLGAALIGYIAGEVIVTDPAIEPWINLNAHWLHLAAPLVGAVIVVDAGRLLAPKRAPAHVRVTEAVAAPVAGFFVRLGVLLAGRFLLTRAPLIVSVGAGYLGYSAGDAALGPQAAVGSAALQDPILHTIGPIVATILALSVAEILVRLFRRDRAASKA